MDTNNPKHKRNLSSDDEDRLKSHSGAAKSLKPAVRQTHGREGQSRLPRPESQVAQAGGSSSQGNGERNLSIPPLEPQPQRKSGQPSKGGKPPEDSRDTSSMETLPSLPSPQSVVEAAGRSSSQGNGEGNPSKPHPPPRPQGHLRQPSKGDKSPEDTFGTTSMEVCAPLPDKGRSDQHKSEKDKKTNIKLIKPPK